jgi:hypothetical protein
LKVRIVRWWSLCPVIRQFGKPLKAKRSTMKKMTTNMNAGWSRGHRIWVWY